MSATGRDDLRWNNVPARVWAPNVFIGAMGAALTVIVALVLLEKWGVSRTANGLINGLRNFAEGL